MRRFYGQGKMSRRFYEVGLDYVRRKRPFDDETISLPEDEAAWATTKRRAEMLFFWHRNHGLHRSEPHPMGKDLRALMATYNEHHAERYRSAGMEVPGCYRPPLPTIAAAKGQQP